jgi:cardiolipin synthase
MEDPPGDRSEAGSSDVALRLKHLPNAISAIRGLLVVPIVFYTISADSEVPILALAFLALAWVSDGLDGWLARRMDAQSELGRVLDPVADKIVIGGTAVALWMTGRVPGWLAGVIVARDVGILALGILMRGRVGSVPRANPVGKVTLVVLVVTLGAYLLRLEQTAAVLRWIALAAVVVSAASYGYRFLGMMRRKETE